VRNAAILGVATLAALTLVGAPVGLGLSVALIATYAVKRGDALFWVLAAALALVPAIRDAGWVVWPALAASVAVASLAVSRGTAWRQVGAGLVRVLAMPRGALSVIEGAPRASRPALRASGIAIVLLAVFLPLFATADAAFAHMLDAVVPQESVDRPGIRAAVWLAFVALGGALVQTGRAAPVRAAGAPRHTLARIEWTLPLGLLVAVFGAFVALQLTALFGGDDYVVRTSGMTYAEYARTGFAQLIAAAALTLAVIAAAGRWAEDRRLRDALLGALCVLTLVILASAYRRLHLYEDAFGFTRLRLAADGAIVWLGALFILVLAARGARWLPRAVVALSATGILAFAASNPDGRIADRNVDRYERTHRIDLDVLAGLSADATPALAKLPPRLAIGVLPGEVRSGGLAGANLARARARRALATFTPTGGSC
jgi:Domain of unknown function (DUF4173)